MGNPIPSFRPLHCSVLISAILIVFIACFLPPPQSNAQPPSAELLPPGHWDHVIVTPQALVGPFTRLANHRRAQDLPSRVVTLGDVARWTGCDDPREGIRAFVALARNAWGTRYVLLGGVADAIPVPRGLLVTPTMPPEDMALDLYYAAPGGDWDADGDGVLGEWDEDQPDLNPVVALGRVPVSTSRQAMDYVRKVIAFEGDPAGSPDGALLVGEVGAPAPWHPGLPVQLDLADMVEKAPRLLTDWPGVGAYVRLYENQNGWPDGSPLSPETFIDEMVSGRHRLLNICVHGNRDAWSMGESVLYRRQLSALEVMTQPVLALAMVPGATATIGECMLQDLVRMPCGGLVAGLGPSTLFYFMPADVFTEIFWRHWASTEVTRLGDVFHGALTEFVATPILTRLTTQTAESLNLLGDPALLLQPMERRTPKGHTRGRLTAATARPNPFNPNVEFSFVLSGVTGESIAVAVQLYDVAGRQVGEILRADLSPGRHRALWDGRDLRGRTMPSGVYFARIHAGGEVAVVRAVLAK